MTSPSGGDFWHELEEHVVIWEDDGPPRGEVVSLPAEAGDLKEGDPNAAHHGTDDGAIDVVMSGHDAGAAVHEAVTDHNADAPEHTHPDAHDLDSSHHTDSAAE